MHLRVHIVPPLAAAAAGGPPPSRPVRWQQRPAGAGLNAALFWAAGIRRSYAYARLWTAGRFTDQHARPRRRPRCTDSRQKSFGFKIIRHEICNGQRLDLQSIQAWLQGPQGSSPRLGTVPARSQGQQEPTGIADRRRGPQVWRLASPCRSRRSRNSSKSTGPPHHMHRRSQRALTHTDTSYNTTQALSTVPR